MKQRLIISLFIIFCCCSNLWALSPEIRFDILKTKLTQQLKEKQYPESLKTMHEIKELGISVPPSLAYFEGKALFESGKKYEAYEILERYVETGGKNAKYYKQAIAYLVNAEATYAAEKEKREAEQIAREQAEQKRREKEAALRQQAADFNAENQIYNNSNTGLMWTLPVPKKYRNNPYLPVKAKGTRQEAKNYCENLDLAGHQDWRLPSMKGLSTIAGKGNKYSSIKWEDYSAGWVWAWGSKEFSSKYEHIQKNKLYSVSSRSMDTDNDKTATIMCVRQESPEKFKEYFNRKYRVIQFKGHKIMVEDRYMISNKRSYFRDPELKFYPAINYCKNLELGGFNDWHLPTKEDILKRLPCQIATRLSFLRDDPDYNDLWYMTPGFLKNKPGVQDPGECEIKRVKHKNTRHHVRCVRDLESKKK